MTQLEPGGVSGVEQSRVKEFGKTIGFFYQTFDNLEQLQP